MLVQAPVGTRLVREGSNAPVHYLALRHDDTPLPITCRSCWICEVEVDVLEEAEAGPRVNGDSRYGYEIQHRECADALSEPACDVCGTAMEEAPHWCAECGNCRSHCECSSIEEALALLVPVGWMTPPVIEAEYADGCGPTCEGC